MAHRELSLVIAEPESADAGAGAGAAEPGPAQVGAASMRRTGDMWEVRFADRTVHLRRSKGLGDLARLLAAPGTEIHCLDLVGGAVEESSTGDTVDSTARRRYEQRIRDLQDDIDAADADHDIERAATLREELDALVDHLAASLGLGGRARHGNSSAERARSTVTQRLRSTMRRIGGDHPDLARHLEASVRTGVYCSYHPEHAIEWTVNTG